MAEAMDSISCLICLEILKDPVTIPCGHSYCMDCIKGYWDQDVQKLLCSCPQCRQTFTPRPVLNKNTIMAELVETMTEMKMQKERLKHCAQAAVEDSEELSKMKVVSPPEPNTRDEFLKYSCQLTLDPNTANRYLHLSEGNRKLTRSENAESYLHHPDRFNFYCQLLCKEALSGTCYWEVERSGSKCKVAVSYKGIGRIGNGVDVSFGRNYQSWTLVCDPSSCSFRHNNISTDILTPCSSRIGVYLNHKAGTLSFYSVSDTMTLLHRVQTTFTQPLYPGFWVGPGYRSSLKIMTPM
ncbi:tripartite motif-containing protein 16-like [Coregonus clupeaformis]|uniref:tripartite motif-containing protein 16-like n=1 Tax=Coregonus clupeaformis TaxID=59861 RepID=UPI001E1C7719|nr:tripartite motif-containing protein 16-like [Coregonus clupeaformis]